MSFSGKVKEELLEHYARARHCDIAELSAIVHMAGEFKVGHGGVCCLKVHTENLGVARKCCTCSGIDNIFHCTGKKISCAVFDNCMRFACSVKKNVAIVVYNFTI